MRSSRQTELQREFPLHAVCSWLGNSPRIAQQIYLLVAEDNFAKAAGMGEVMVGDENWWCGEGARKRASLPDLGGMGRNLLFGEPIDLV